MFFLQFDFYFFVFLLVKILDLSILRAIISRDAVVALDFSNQGNFPGRFLIQQSCPGNHGSGNAGPILKSTRNIRRGGSRRARR
jgi:hypothetical protein